MNRDDLEDDLERQTSGLVVRGNYNWIVKLMSFRPDFDNVEETPVDPLVVVFPL